VEFNEPLCSPYWDQFKEKVRLTFFGDATSLFTPSSRAAPQKARGDVYVLFSPLSFRFNTYHRGLKHIWKAYTKAKTERSCALQRLMTFMDNTLITRIPVLIGSVLLSKMSCPFCLLTVIARS
jgi:hypothetical protein